MFAIIGGLFLLVAVGLLAAVFLGGLGAYSVNAQMVYLLGSISAGVIAVVFSLVGVSEIPKKLDEMLGQIDVIRGDVDKLKNK